MADQQAIESSFEEALNDFNKKIEQGIWPEDKIDEIIKIANDVPEWKSKVKDFEAYCDQLYANFNNDKDAGSSHFITGINFGLINFRDITMKLPSKPDVNTENVNSYSIFGFAFYEKAKKVRSIATSSVEKNGKQSREKLEENVGKVLENQLIIMASLEDIKKSLKDITDRVTNIEEK